ncbi:MAG TPA: hypothetical protein VFT34_16820 [Verrucomicrobiae bacterium]|nr:hypothetical protein [Verrucomicrobiae bacterium]
MILVDVNLLLYAANPRYPEHLQAKVWWKSSGLRWRNPLAASSPSAT